MKISEEQLKTMVLRIWKELEEEKAKSGGQQNLQKVYMMCSAPWNEKYPEFLREMDASGACDVCPVIPASWERQGYETALKSHKSCGAVLYHSCRHPADLVDAVTVFPVVTRDVLAKTALCISDTFENAWITACIESGSRAVFLRSGLVKFSGKEPPAYINRIMEYCRQVLEYGVVIGGIESLAKPFELVKPLETGSGNGRIASDQGKRRVISVSNIEQLASGGVLHLQQGDIVTDLARDRAKYLNIIFR